MLELFNGITTLLILHTLLYMVGPKKSTILSCGLFGYIGVRGNHTFSWDKFNHLGLDNDERGGDSIGRVVGDQIEKFVSKKTKTTYQEYVINTKNSDPSHIALGHTRKASVGEISQATAQPVVLDLPDGSGQFIMIHNGTLHNWEELATRYGINKTGKSDSMVFAEIIMNNGYDVLLQYNGAAAIIIKDDRFPDTLKVFKGRSKTYGNKVEEERPLYYYQESETSMYISSREEGLYFIGGDADTVADFEPNKLYTIFEGQIIEQVVYDRSDCSQNKVFAYNNNNFNNNNRRSGSYGNAYEYGYYGDWDGYEDQRESSNVTTIKMKTERITPEANPDKIVSARLRYYFFEDGKTPMYANGPINLNEDGIKNRSILKSGEKTYYFYRGIMLKDKAAYDACKRELGKARFWADNENAIIAICKYSMYPVCTVDSVTPTWENIRHYNTDAIANQPKAPFFTGKINPIFGKKEYSVEYGSLKAIVYRSFANSPKHETDTKVIQLPAVFNDNRGSILRHPYNCECKACVDAMNEAFRANLQKKQEEDYQEYEEVPDDCELCPDCGGTGEEATSMNYCVTCGGKGFIKIQDDDPADVQMDNDVLNKAVDDGLQALLLAIDKCRADVEEIGITTKHSINTLNNLSKLEDLLLEVSKFKSLSILTGYEQF